MGGSVKQRWKHAQREPLRLGLLLGDLRQKHRALALDVLGPERGVPHHVGEQVERGGKVRLQR